MSERKAGIRGAGSMLLGMQLSSVRGAEKQKAVKKLEELSPRIEEYRDKGFGVTVTIEVEVPDKIDIAAIWAGIGDPSQVVYFKDMWISYAGPPLKEPRQVPRPEGPGTSGPRKEPQRYHQNEAVEDARHRKEWYLNKARKGWHLVTRDLYLPANREAPPREVKAKSLLFRPTKVESWEPGRDFNYVGSNRIIYIDGQYGFQMWNTYSGRGYRRTDTPAGGLDRMFPKRLKLENDAKDERHKIDTTLDWRMSEDGKSYEIHESALFTNLEGVPVWDYAAKIQWVQA